jgi:hypothetical protein
MSIVLLSFSSVDVVRSHTLSAGLSSCPRLIAMLNETKLIALILPTALPQESALEQYMSCLYAPAFDGDGD